MAFNTHRDNIEPMFWCIAFVMVVFLCSFSTFAFESIWTRQVSTSDSNHYGSFSFSSLRIPFYPFLSGGFAFYGLLIPPEAYLARIRLEVLFYPSLAVVGLAVFPLRLVFISFSSFALGIFTAAFAMNFFAHFGLLVKFLANRTRGLPSISCPSILPKFRKWFNFLASAALLRYGSFRHNQFPKNWLCFEPPQGRSLCGFLYSMAPFTLCQEESREK